MKKILILLALIISIGSYAQDTTYIFVNDTIQPEIVLDTVLFESDFIIKDTITINREFNQDFELMPWFVRDSVNINQYKFALRHVQIGYKKHSTTQVIRMYRYRNVRYIRMPEKIEKKLIIK